MIFKRKRGMIDIRELQRRGIVQEVKKEPELKTDREGFIEIEETEKLIKRQSGGQTTTAKSSSNFFGFLDAPSAQNSNQNSFSTEQDGYNKREVDAKITNLDNKIYKLEQRVELLERKLDIKSSNSNTDVMGW